jgi:hypothetical protein
MKNNTEEKKQEPKPTHPGNIYDVFVKNIFGRVLIFVDFLLNYADPNFINKIDLEKISKAPTHYVGQKGDELILDLVFSCPFKNRIDAKVMIIFEHAGNTFEDIPVRLLCYATAIWWAELKEGKKILSVIYFIVVRTGAKPYLGVYPKVADWLAKDENGQPIGFVPDLHYYVVDLPAYDGEHLCGRPELRAAMGILKNMTEGNEDEFAKAMLPISEMTDDRQQIMITKDILEFVAKAFNAHHKHLGAEAVHKALTPIFSERAENMTTTIFDEIRAEGEAKGEVRGRIKDVLRILNKKFKKVPESILQSVNSYTDEIALDSLFESALDCETLEEFKRELVK